jgi:hypothetical protein
VRLGDLHGLVADAQREAVAFDAHGHIAVRHVEDDQRVPVVLKHKALRLRRMQAHPRHVEQRRESVGRELVAGDAVVVLDAEDEHAALGVGEARDLLGHLVARLAAVTRALLALLALEHRLAIEVLALVATEEGREVESGRGHGAEASSDCSRS